MQKDFITSRFSGGIGTAAGSSGSNLHLESGNGQTIALKAA